MYYATYLTLSLDYGLVKQKVVKSLLNSGFFASDIIFMSKKHQSNKYGVWDISLILYLGAKFKLREKKI